MRQSNRVWGCLVGSHIHVFVLLPRFIFTVCLTMTSLRDLYKECQAVQLVTQWTKKDWWTSVISSSDSASLEKKVILHLREFLACVNVLVQMKTNIMYRPVLVSLESAVKQASRRDIDSLIRSMK
ncbi:unnamed protein product [Sphagnum troendelagicum]